jgi:CRISPR system Cascade subunit CasD
MSSPAPSGNAARPDRHDGTYSLVLRLAGPLQSWGGQSQFNRRDTTGEPTKSGILGLLAAAQGRRRSDPIEDLLTLRLAVRTDQPGSLLRDYHTVSDLRGRPLLSAQVNTRGVQKQTSPAKLTHVTQRFYLQDAAFVAAVSGPPPLLASLAAAVTHPSFPLALGRRACPPTQPIIIPPVPSTEDDRHPLWPGTPRDVLQQVAWQASPAARASIQRNARRAGQDARSAIDLPVTADDETSGDLRGDVPLTFDHQARGFTTRRVRQEWAHIPTGCTPPDDEQPTAHDPFTLLGW